MPANGSNHHKSIRPRRRALAALGVAAILSLPALLAQNQSRITPEVPKADRHQPGKVFLEHADVLEMDQQRNPDFQVLRGSVVFRKDDMFMYCDSAYFYESTNSLDAHV